MSEVSLDGNRIIVDSPKKTVYIRHILIETHMDIEAVKKILEDHGVERSNIHVVHPDDYN